MRRLVKTVVAGGVVHSVGTAATPELEALIPRADQWSGPPEFATKVADSETSVDPANEAPETLEPAEEPVEAPAEESPTPRKRAARKRAPKD